MMLKTNKILFGCIFISSIICIADDTDNKNVNGLKSHDKQFEFLYEKMPVCSLPIEHSKSFPDFMKFIEAPESLFQKFEFEDGDYFYKSGMLKLPKYKDVRVIIAKVYPVSGAKELFLCTFSNNKFIDKLEIYSEGDIEYKGNIGTAIGLTSFSITKDYNIIVKNSIIPESMNRDKEVNVTREFYVINKSGMFVKK